MKRTSELVALSGVLGLVILLGVLGLVVAVGVVRRPFFRRV